MMHTPNRSLLDIYSLSLDAFPDPELVENPRHVWRKLDPSANKAEVVRTFIHIDIVEATLRQRKSSCQSSHSSAKDGNLQIPGLLGPLAGEMRGHV